MHEIFTVFKIKYNPVTGCGDPVGRITHFTLEGARAAAKLISNDGIYCAAVERGDLTLDQCPMVTAEGWVRGRRLFTNL